MSVILIRVPPKPLLWVLHAICGQRNMVVLDTLARSAGAKATGREDFDAFALQGRTERGARSVVAVAARCRGCRVRQQDRGRARRPAPLFRAMGAGDGRRKEGFWDRRRRIQSADRLEA